MTPSEKLYQTAVSFLGKDASPRDTAPDEYGCMESVHAIVKQALGFDMGGGNSTNLAYKALKVDTRFKKVTEWKRGCLIISPTGYGNNEIVGHIGIMSDDEKIMSNTSKDGIWRENFTLKSWIARYRDIGELPIMFFEPV